MPCIEKLASLHSVPAYLFESGDVSGEAPLLPIQRWFFDSHFAVPHHVNQSFMLRTPSLDADRLSSSVGELIQRRATSATAIQSGADRHRTVRRLSRTRTQGYRQEGHPRSARWMAEGQRQTRVSLPHSAVLG